MKPVLTQTATRDKNTLPRYIGYLRVSKERNATGSYTFETQEQRIRESLDRKFGPGKYHITFFQDDGLSGGYGLTPTGVQPKVRPKLRRIAEMLLAEGWDGVIVYGQNRLMRNTRGLMELVQDVLLPNGKALLSATEELDIETAQGRTMMYIKGLFDEQQREDIIKRNKDAAATRAEQGYPIGQVGYGWQPDPDADPTAGRRGIVAIQEERHWLIHIRDRYLSGWNAPRIAAELNELDVPSPLRRKLWSKKATKLRTRDGREPQWTNGTVWNVVRNPLHAGLIRTPAGELIQGKHWEHRYWEPETLQELERVHKERMKRFKTVTGGQKQEHLLAGIIHCARCGRRLYMSSTSQTTRNHRSYKCHNGKHEGKHTCPDVVARAEWVDDAVVEEIRNIAQEPLMKRLLREEVAKAADEEDKKRLKERTQLKRKLVQNEEKLDRWNELFATGKLKERQFLNYSEKLCEEEEIATSRLQEIEQTLNCRQHREQQLERIQQTLLQFPTVWKELDNDEKRQVLSLLIEEGGLTVDREGRDILLRLKVHLLPERQRTIIYRTYRGINRTKATGLQTLTQRQMVMLYYAAQGKTRRESAALMGCKVPSLYSIEKAIRQKLGGISWAKAVELSRERVEANASQLPFGSGGRAAKKGDKPEAPVRPFISPVLQEVFVLFAQGATVAEVAEQLGLSTTTVQGRRARILKLFGTSSMFEAVRKAKVAITVS